MIPYAEITRIAERVLEESWARFQREFDAASDRILAELDLQIERLYPDAEAWRDGNGGES